MIIAGNSPFSKRHELIETLLWFSIIREFGPAELK
jgi:hypothetical protein